MGISLKPEHVKRYEGIAVLIAKYGRPGPSKEAVFFFFFFLAAVGGVGLMLQILRDDRTA